MTELAITDPKWDDFYYGRENPVSYHFVPLTEYELSAYDSLVLRNKKYWNTRAKTLNKRANQYCTLGRVKGRTIYALVFRYGHRCAYCGKTIEWNGFNNTTRYRVAVSKGILGTFDHVIALRNGGVGDVQNLLPCCSACNQGLEKWDAALNPIPSQERQILYDMKVATSETGFPMNQELGTQTGDEKPRMMWQDGAIEEWKPFPTPRQNQTKAFMYDPYEHRYYWADSHSQIIDDLQNRGLDLMGRGMIKGRRNGEGVAEVYQDELPMNVVPDVRQITQGAEDDYAQRFG